MGGLDFEWGGGSRGGSMIFNPIKLKNQKCKPPVSPQAPPYFFYMGGLLFSKCGGHGGALRLDGGAQLWSPSKPPHRGSPGILVWFSGASPFIILYT